MSAIYVTNERPGPPLGRAIPANERHAVSASLPAWADNVDYELGKARVVETMEIGYPRCVDSTGDHRSSSSFFVNRMIQKLASIAESRLGEPHERCYLFPSKRAALSCQHFLATRSPSISSRIAEVNAGPEPEDRDWQALAVWQVFAVFMHEDHVSVGKQFWQHTGDGVSSRRAEYILNSLSRQNETIEDKAKPASGEHARTPSQRGWTKNRHYSRRTTLPTETNGIALVNGEEAEDPLAYVEERYGRNLARSFGALAKTALRKRIAGVLHSDDAAPTPDGIGTKIEDLSLSVEEADLRKVAARRAEQSDRGVGDLTEDDVYLYPTGMSAIFHAHQLLLRRAEQHGRPIGKSVCFGFPYIDTLKILQKWGPGAYHFGHGTDSDIDKLEALLESLPADEPPILSLFTEFPSNPLLRSPDLARLRRLADKYGFALVVDETIGTFVNVEILPVVDIVVSSLTKVFSGDGNVMSGRCVQAQMRCVDADSLVLNPSSAHYDELKETMLDEYADELFDEDAIFLERNSRDFRARIARIDVNAEAICDLLEQRRQQPGSVIKALYYPKYQTPDHYRARLRPHREGQHAPGYGGLFSLVFDTREAAAAFFDALNCCKGPSLGTAFTLSCPYTLLAHFTELDWAKELGVDEALVRISIGTEELGLIKTWVEEALEAAERVGKE